MRLTMMAIVCFANLAITTVAQTSDEGADQALSNSLAASVKAMHASIRRNLAEAAESMSTENYGFRPTPEVRTFAQLIGHVTNANLLFCSAAQGAPSPSKTNAEGLTTKEAALTALRDALAYCDAVYRDTTDANFSERTSIGRGNKPTPTTRGAILMFNMTHNNEHYGNIVVYLRLKGVVPPSTARVQSGRR